MELISPAHCVISLATGRRRYQQGLARLGQSLMRSGFSGEFISWPPESFPTGCPEHLAVPFAFKPFCFMEARERGMNLALWLDSSCVVIRPLDRIFRQIQQEGYVLFRNRSLRVGQWASDEALRKLGVSREQAMAMAEVNAAAVGLNLLNPVALEFLRRWHQEACEQIAFRGVREPLQGAEDYSAVKWNRAGRVSADPRVQGHRHDQTVAGILAHQLGMTLTTPGLQVHSRWHRGIGPRSAILIERGARRGQDELTALEQIEADRDAGRVAQVVNRIRAWTGLAGRGPAPAP